MFSDTWRSWVAGLLCGGALLSWTAHSHAQSVGTPGYDSAPLARGSILSLWGSEPRAPGQYAVAVGFQARSGSTADSRAAAVSSTSSFGLLATVGFFSGMDASLALDLQRAQASGESSADEEQAQTVLGDVRLVPRLRLWGDSDGGIALLVPTWIPAGPESIYSDSGVRLRPELAATWSNRSLSITGQAGYRLRAEKDAWGTTSSNFVGVGAGLEYAVADSVSVLGELIGHWLPHGDTANDSPLGAEASGAVRIAMSDWAAQLGAGGGFTGADSGPGFQVLASVSFNPAALDSVPPSAMPAPGQRPQAVAQASEPSFYPHQTADWQPPPSAKPKPEPQAEPEPQPKPPAEDKLVADSEPAEPEPGESEQPQSGPSQPSSEAEAEPEPLARSEWNEEGEKARDGEVEETDVEVERLGPIEIAAPSSAPQEQIPLPDVPEVLHFAPNQMQLDEKQRAQLDEIAALLTALPEDVRLLVEGHSDDTGPARFNRSLSRMRASTVRYHLLQQGIPWPRIGVRAYGASRPAVSGSSKEDLAKNRRVEFRLVRTR